MKMDTVLLMSLVITFIIIVVYLLQRTDRFSKKNNLMLVGLILAVIAILLSANAGHIKTDIKRIFHNSRPKSPPEIYEVLFGVPIDSCVRIVNLRDQVIPQIDCCIWMELAICAAEINRISLREKYTSQSYARADSSDFLNNFKDRPAWWTPQDLGDSILILHVKKSNRHQQSIIFALDSMRAYVCDMAL